MLGTNWRVQELGWGTWGVKGEILGPVDPVAVERDGTSSPLRQSKGCYLRVYGAALRVVTEPLWASFTSLGVGVTTPHRPTKGTWTKPWASQPLLPRPPRAGWREPLRWAQGTTMRTPAAAGMTCLGPLARKGGSSGGDRSARGIRI